MKVEIDLEDSVIESICLDELKNLRAAAIDYKERFSEEWELDAYALSRVIRMYTTTGDEE